MNLGLKQKRTWDLENVSENVWAGDPEADCRDDQHSSLRTDKRKTQQLGKNPQRNEVVCPAETSHTSRRQHDTESSGKSSPVRRTLKKAQRKPRRTQATNT